MLYLYPSNKTETLAALIAELIDRYPLSQPFKPETILIQSQGMGTWLQQQLSDYSGIAALIDCRMPASFIWKLAEQLMPDQPHRPLFEKNNLRWEIFRRLPEKLDQPEYQLLKHYVAGQTQSLQTVSDSGQVAPALHSSQQKLLFELSSVIADVFDAYQNYRPDWIDAWEQGARIFSDKQTHAQTGSARLQALEHWQADLWCSVYPAVALEQRQHRASLFAGLIKRLANAPQNLKQQLPERLFIFGLSALPPHWLELMTSLAKHLDIHFMVHNPCRFYWGDVLTPVHKLKLEHSLVVKGVSVETAADTFLEGNPLLASWGKVGRDYLSLLSSLSDIQETEADLFEDISIEQPAAQLSALAWLQDDMLNLQAQAHVIAAEDDSIRFADCHSHLREVEALQDYLFDLLERHPELKPKDIIVMMPDVQEFAPLIDAVFSRAAADVHGQPQYLPYGISDQRLSMDQPLLETLSGLLSLSSSRVTGTEVLDWLEMPAIRSRFDINEAELEDIKTWIQQLNIRWGLSEQHRDNLLRIKGSGAGNTWLKASQRLLAGYLFGEQNIISHGDQACLAFPQRSPERQLLAGKLMRFLDIIESTIQLQERTLPLSQWLPTLSECWQNWLDFELVAADIQQLLSRFESTLEAEIACTEFDEPVSFSVIAAVLGNEFENQRVSQRFLAGRINFCTLMPMRSIPFKVVCMLGMNEGSYPRPVQRQSFDLLALSPARAGDRSRRDDDRYLFLEALCSARSHLYLSYCGRDIQDNSERFPSLLISELRAYCEQYFSVQGVEQDSACSILERWTLVHHLQPFHPDYFYHREQHLDDKHSSGTLKTFSSEWLRLINPEYSASTEQGIKPRLVKQKNLSENAKNIAHAGEIYPLTLDKLQACAAHPLRYYYMHVLQVSLRGMEEQLEVSEPFAIAGLEAYSLKKELAQNWFSGRDELQQNLEPSPENILRTWQLADKLPRPPLDKLYADAIEKSLHPMRQYLYSALADKPHVHELDVQLGKYQVSGTLLISGKGLLELYLGKSPGTGFFSFWVKHVFWSLVQAENGVADTISRSSECSRFIGPESELLVPLLSAEVAREYSLALCSFFESASQAPYAFLPKTAYALIFESRSKAASAFQGNPYFSGENMDPYWQRFCQLSALGQAYDWQQMPELESSVLFQQIEPLKEEMQVTSLREVITASEISASAHDSNGEQGL